MKRTQRLAVTLERPTYDLRGLQREAMKRAHKRCGKQPQSMFERYMNEELARLIAWHEETQK